MGIVAAYVVPHPPLIVPAVGRGEERAIQKTVDAYREVARRIAAHAPDTVVVSSPHAPIYRDCFHVTTECGMRGSMAQFGAPLAALNMTCDDELASGIVRAVAERGVATCGSTPRDGELDHATFVPLHFVDEARPAPYRLVRVGLSGLDASSHRSFGRAVAQAVRELDRRVVFVASGDLSHKLLPSGPYGYAPEGPVFDGNVTKLLDSGDLEGLFAIDEAFAEAAAECGLRSFQIMAGALEDVSVTHELLSYEGPFGVGYAVAAFEVEGAGGDGAVASAADASIDAAAAADARANEADVDPFVALARATVEEHVRTGHVLARPDSLPPELAKARAGVFVSLHAGDSLRGCIGTIEATRGSVADEVIRNAIAAATEDPRFPPVRESELDGLSYSVDVLFPAEPIDSAAELDPARYGVIVTKGFRRGLLLPNLEGVDTVDEQLSIAKRKAGISPWDADVELARFEVVRHDRDGQAHRS